MALDPERPIDWEKLAKEGAKDRMSAFMEMFRCGLIDGGTVIREPFVYVKITGGGSSIIDVKPEDYKITDAPKELPGVSDVDAPGSNKKP
jgi:hypothetical protein